jgi:two-component system response regulator DevR
LINAIELVHGGQSIIDQNLTATVRERMATLITTPRPSSPVREHDLSRQERRILTLVVEGQTNKEIGRALGLSDKTVKNYLSNAFQKLNVQRRSHAAALFERRVRAKSG